ncbi:8-oxo-dGTP diphosphatase [Barrientosiimonas humi]|uniref:8-oxo-dGTP diphosphatase n=1 Tax=Barrientosiimonas humi TaxID=999931 RepID=A0A542XF53_9MICO|nr:NUDIX hydrolase [Barrientosiimonas humi]TQL34436.1 8-oxo-dGTP diphosphatase [Barrientosiimonas humi]
MIDPRPRAVAAAGTLLWRRRRGRLEVALVHRPRYDDWSWPKGKLDPGEMWAVAAGRETEEETGLVARLGIPLPRALYVTPRDELKEVRYWAATPTGGHGELLNEIDRVEWLAPDPARLRLSYARDVLQLRALLEAERAGHLDTWPLLVVRHAQSMPRSQWSGEDGLRPLDPDGLARARALVPLLQTYGLDRLVSSPSVRCVDTVSPFAESAQVRVRTKKGLSEEGYEARPEKAVRHTDSALQRGVAAALCTHRPLLPDVLGHLAERAVAGSAARRTLSALATAGIDKGEVLVCQVSGAGDEAVVVTVERHRP